MVKRFAVVCGVLPAIVVLSAIVISTSSEAQRKMWTEEELERMPPMRRMRAEQFKDKEFRSVGPVTTPEMTKEELAEVWCEFWSERESRADRSDLPEGERRRRQFRIWWTYTQGMRGYALPCAPPVIREFYGWTQTDIDNLAYTPLGPEKEEMRRKLSQLSFSKGNLKEFPPADIDNPVYIPIPVPPPPKYVTRPCTGADERWIINNLDKFMADVYGTPGISQEEIEAVKEERRRRECVKELDKEGNVVRIVKRFDSGDVEDLNLKLQQERGRGVTDSGLAITTNPQLDTGTIGSRQDNANQPKSQDQRALGSPDEADGTAHESDGNSGRIWVAAVVIIVLLGVAVIVLRRRGVLSGVRQRF